MTTIARPSRNCTAPGCRAPQRPGQSTCARHANLKWETRSKRDKGYQSAEYYRERQSVKRDRWYCHLGHLAGCRGNLHAHHTQPGNHHRSTLAPLCQHHHMKLEGQGKAGELARALAVVMQELADG